MCAVCVVCILEEKKIRQRQMDKEGERWHCPGASSYCLHNVGLNSKHRSLIPARQPWSYYVANRHMPSPCINLPLNPKKCLNSKTWPRNVKWLQRSVPKMERKLCKEQTCWQKWSSANYSVHIHKALANLREWHQFSTGQLTCFFFFFLYLPLNTKENCI